MKKSMKRMIGISCSIVLTSFMTTGVGYCTALDGNATISDFREEMAEHNAMGAIMYLGWYEGELGSDDFYEVFSADVAAIPVLGEVTDECMIEGEGFDVYCFIPADLNASVAVNEWIINEGNDFQGEVGEVLYRSESGEPIIVRGGGEYTPGFEINVVDSEGNILSGYTPGISGMDGSVILPCNEKDIPLLLDYSLYDVEE